MNIQTQIEQKLRSNFNIEYFQIENESDQHSGPAQESHFKVILVTPDFEGVSRVKRHQAVYQVLKQEMPKFHALALHTFTPDEWSKTTVVTASPVCRGGDQA